MWGKGRAAAVVGALVVGAVSLAVAPVTIAANPGVPSDVRFVSTWHDPLTGYDWDRYQQYAAPLNVFVDGGQLIVIRKGSKIVDQGGAHYDGLRVTTQPRLNADQAIASAAGQAPQSVSSGTPSGASLTHDAQLRVDPKTNRQFYRVSSHAPGTLLYQNIDANTGAVLAAWSGIEYLDPPYGTGVKTDTKDLSGNGWTGAGAALTSSAGGGSYQLVSGDGRFVTVDAKQTNSYPDASQPMKDPDNVWDGSNERAAVDAQYYAALTVNFYQQFFDYDLTSAPCPAKPTESPPLGPIVSVVHYSRSYANAFWDPMAKVMVYGDGDGRTYSQMSGAQDVVSHELTHAVTTCHADLDYLQESGALNEAFSDIMGTSAEYMLEEPTSSSHCRLAAGQVSCADWWIAEDLIIGGSDYALRSLANPALLGQPSHYSQRTYSWVTNPAHQCGLSNDYCGVHTNSGIANHAFYLLAHGGRNARCSGPSDIKADCDVVVPGQGVTHAANIFLRGFWLLNNTSNFCDARSETIQAAQDIVNSGLPTGYTQSDVAATELAWDAVGVYCPSVGPFNVTANVRSAVAQPGGNAHVTLAVTGSPSGQIAYSLSGAAGTFTPPSPTGATSVTLQINVPADMTSGVYPVMVSATDSSATNSVTRNVPLVLVVDTDAPTATVSGIAMATGDTVGSDGHVPLHISWSTSDATSGVASGALSVDATQVGTGTAGPTTYSSLDGNHSVQASATDQAGNTGSSSILTIGQTTSQFSSAALTKPGKWIAFSAGGPWSAARYSKTKGATATLTFTGTDVAWVSTRDTNRGKAKVYIDGVKQAVVDLKASATKANVIVFSAGGLTAGQHTIQVFVNGTSGRPRVDVDGFVVLAPGS